MRPDLIALKARTAPLRTLREAPSEAENDSHRLILRAALARQDSAGVYSYLPLGLGIIDDDLGEPDESISLTLDNPSPNTVFDGANLNLQILDNERPGPELLEPLVPTRPSAPAGAVLAP